MRHSAATITLAAGVSPKVVFEQLGHASTAFTLDTYAHVLPHMQDEAAARAEELLFPGTASRIVQDKGLGTRYDHGMHSGAETSLVPVSPITTSPGTTSQVGSNRYEEST